VTDESDPAVRRLADALHRLAAETRDRRRTGRTHDDAAGTVDTDDAAGTVDTDDAIGFDPLPLLDVLHRAGGGAALSSVTTRQCPLGRRPRGGGSVPGSPGCSGRASRPM
jgi:hypothetical protein